MKFIRSMFCALRYISLGFASVIWAIPVQSSQFVYVSDPGTNSVQVINTLTNTIVASVPVGLSPDGVAITPDGSYAWISNFGSGNISVIDTATNTVSATINGIGSTNRRVAITPNGTFAYAASFGGSAVKVISTATNTVAATIPVPNPLHVSITPNGAFVYVPDQGNKVYVISTATNAIVETLQYPEFSTTVWVSFSPDGSRAYVSNQGNGTVSVLDTATNVVVATVATGASTYGSAVTPDGAFLYVAAYGSNTVSVVNTATNTVTATLSPGNVVPVGVAITPEGDFAYVTNYSGGSISVIDTATNVIVETIQGMANPAFLAITGNREVINAAPDANAGADQQSNEGTMVTLDGSGSSDPEGAVITYLWTQLAGPTVVVDDPTSFSPSFTAPPVASNETLTFSLIVADGVNVSAPDFVDVTILDSNGPPVAGYYHLTDLGTLGGTYSGGFAINESGQVTGYSHTAGDAELHAFLWDGTSMQDLGTLGGSASLANAINDSGQVTGFSFTVGSTAEHAFLWDGTAMQDLGTLGGADGRGNAINAAGEVTGVSRTSVVATGQHAFLWDGASMQDLGTLGGNYSNGLAINDSGQVTGYSNTVGNAEEHAFLWDGTSMQDLGTLGGNYSLGNAINASGQVTGQSRIAGDAEVHAILWDGSSMLDLGTLGGSNSLGSAINAGGQVTGYSHTTGDAELRAFRWNGTSMQDLGTLGGAQSVGQSINASGQVTGYSFLASAGPHAFLWSGTSMQDLNTLVATADPLKPYVTLSDGIAINDFGQIVANGIDSRTNQSHAYLVSPHNPDATPPVIAPSVSGSLGNNGWYVGLVSVSWNISDAESAITSSTGCDETTVSTDTSGLTFTCSATSPGGTSTQPVTIKRDATSPSATASSTPPANAAGWHVSVPVTVSFTGSDAVSGLTVDGCSVPVVLTGDGAAQSASGQCVDNAGNVGSVTETGINIDTAPPSVVATLTPTPNAGGWNNTDVTISFVGSDDASGVASCSSAVVINTEGVGFNASGSCTDVAGNGSASITSAEVNIDKTLPVVSIVAPLSGASYAVGTTFASSYSCGDDTSGIASCTGTVASGANFDTSSVGTKTFSVNASDLAGNVASAGVTYTVTNGSTPLFTVNPTALDFGVQALNIASPARTVTVTNTGTVALPITSISRSGTNANQFSTTTCGTSIAAGASCMVSVTFKPTTTGSKNAVMSINAGGGAGTKTVALSGTGSATAFVLTPTTLAFGDQAVTFASPPSLVTLTNTGILALPITSITRSGTNANQFSQTNTCGSSVAVGASCTINVVFKPTTEGVKSATLNVNGGGGSGTNSVALSGTGIVATYTLAPASISFGSQSVSVASAAQLVTLTNTGTLALLITNITKSGNQFSLTHSCGASVAIGGSCTISVVFKPTTAGEKTSILSVKTGGRAGTKTVNLIGSGVVPVMVVSPLSLVFGNQTRNTSSSPQTVTVTNVGAVQLPITSITRSGANAGQFSQTNNCAALLGVGTTCVIDVVFKPTSAGVKTATLNVNGGGGSGTQAVSLSGTGN